VISSLLIEHVHKHMTRSLRCAWHWIWFFCSTIWFW